MGALLIGVGLIVNGEDLTSATNWVKLGFCGGFADAMPVRNRDAVKEAKSKWSGVVRMVSYKVVIVVLMPDRKLIVCFDRIAKK